MDKSDWMIVGVRLLGLYMFVESLQGLVGAIFLYEYATPVNSVIGYSINLGIGYVLMMRAYAIESWFRDRDTRLSNRPGGQIKMGQ